MQRHPHVPWIAFEPVPGGVSVACTVCGARATTAAQGADAFTRAHAQHQGPSAARPGLGDAVAAVAKPVARAFGMNPSCTPCEARRHALNQMVPAVPFLRRR